MMEKRSAFLSAFPESFPKGPAARRAVCAGAALVTFILFVDVMIIRGVYPFGGNCILRTDLFHQYAPFYSELRHKLLSGESFSFTWDSGLGANFASLSSDRIHYGAHRP